MLITPAAIRALNTTFSKVFQDGYGSTAPWYQQFCTTVPSSTASNDYGWMAAIPQMREWVGERVVNNLASHHYAIPNKTWESTIGVKREDIDDDNLGVYQPLFQALGEVVSKQPDTLVTQLFKLGHSTECFDGQNFFDTDHPVNLLDSGMGTQSNYEASGFALTQANYEAAQARMMSWVNENGLTLGVMPDTLVVPPALAGAGRRILEAEFIQGTAAAVSNVTKGTARLVILPELAGQDDNTTWYLLQTSGAIKPFVYQTRRAPVLVPKVANTDDGVFWDNKYHWGVDKRDNCGYGLWFKAFKAAA